MNDLYSKWYEQFETLSETFGSDELYQALDSLLISSRNTFAFNRKIMEKAIDVSWVEAIENGITHVDNFLRNPRKTIEDVEEIVPIALSRKTTVESVKHLAQHTDLIQSIDKKTGKITPSKILNVHKEESLFTYENKFVNTLIDRLYIFINTRYEKLAQVSRDEEVFSLGYDTVVDDGAGGKMKIDVKIETVDSLDSYDANGYTVWQRVEKLKTAIEGYKGSELCRALGNTYIRPPVMRTNAIMKNVDLKACLTLWQYIESYDKVGYEINVQNTAVQPQQEYVDDFYKLVILNLLLFRSYMNNDNEDKLKELKSHTSKPMAPKFLKKFDKELAADYSVSSETTAGYIAAEGTFRFEKRLPVDLNVMFEQLSEIIKIETAYLAELEQTRAEEEKRRQEEEARLAEQQRIEEARLAELERIRLEKEEEERRVQEMLEKKRAEQEAEERERQRLEEERLARLEEIRLREEEKRLKREEEERIAAERERIKQNKEMARNELGEAEGLDEEALKTKEPDQEELEKQAYSEVTEEEIEEVKAEMENEAETEGEAFEDPRAVAARKKLEQQRLEKERAETERAQRLKAERKRLESKPFKVIYREYSWNPIYVLIRLIRHFLAVVLGIVPADTDNPRYRQILADKKKKQELKEHEKQERQDMEVYYRKYAHSVKYDFLRFVGDMKFKRKKRKADKNKPKPAYTPPNRTPEEQKTIDLEMKRLYREYHVSVVKKIVLAIQERKKDKLEIEKSIRESEASISNEDIEKAEKDDGANRTANIIVAVITAIALAFVIYVMVCSAKGKAVNVFGKSVLKVVTGSMEPSIHVGDYIVVEKTDTNALSEGDIISFYSEQSDIRGLLVTHRIVGKNTDGSYITKGDANPVSDTVSVTQDKIVGKYTGKARFFIWVNSFVNAKKLLLLLVVIPMLLISLYEAKTVVKIGREVAEKDKLTPEEKREAAMREAIEKEKKRLEEMGFDPENEVNTIESRETDEKEND
ncbi:signal peptidase I [Ruminococcus flavefaciens]|uniref:Signal peptidase I n=1 Tax=Ruminococcus flavefaciens TaxID=1265 RepID=A0A1K1LKF3_RUMFL|nr:signal peptidase I [Ruminococcus flavefaciens]SFW11369.1 signal peptidase I [Ruminococcus flavefaciens]